MRTAVVGGGIAGLSAAWELRGRADITVYEPGDPGGRIRTERFEERLVESGPDAFITRVPEGLELCAELGIVDLVEPAAGRTLIWWDGRPRALPEGLVLGVPRQLGPTIRSGLISPAGLLRAAADLIMPATPPPGDLSVRELVSRRFGKEIADRLVDPLVGGIHAADTDYLSAECTVPQLLQAARGSRSLLLGLRRTGAGGPAGPIFATPRQGLTSMVERLVDRLAKEGVPVERQSVSSVRPVEGGWALEPVGQVYDSVVLATPAATAAGLLGTEAPSGLGAIESASVAIVTLGYPRFETPASANGILVPRSSGMLMTACSFASAKWPHWAGPGRTILRVSTGRHGDDRALEMDDDGLAGRLTDEVSTVLGLAAGPETVRVSRWPRSFPQYRVGHRELTRSIDSELRARFPGVEVCGSSYGGAGIPACIGSGRAAARRVLAFQAEKEER